MPNQTLDTEYDLHKQTVIHLAKAELEGQQIGSKKQHIQTMILILQKKEIPNKQIRKILYKDFDGYVSDRFIRMVCVTMEVETDNEKAEALPLEDSSDSRHEVSYEKPYAELRNQLIKFNYDIKDEADANIEELLIDEIHTLAELNDSEQNIKKGDTIILSRNWSTFFESEEINSEFFNLIRDTFYNNKDYDWNKARDTRQSILPKMRLPIFAFKSLVMNQHFCSRYFAHIKKATTITPKKLSQFIKDVHSLSDLLHFVKEDAWKWNFIDIKCPDNNCRANALKIRMLDDGTWIFVCKNYKVHITERTYPATLLQSRLNQLYKNKTGSAAKYLSAKGITTPRD